MSCQKPMPIGALEASGYKRRSWPAVPITQVRPVWAILGQRAMGSVRVRVFRAGFYSGEMPAFGHIGGLDVRNGATAWI
ncbi:MAG: hypothetical protein U1G07_15695 [Verrucomicrobiota bacterium]